LASSQATWQASNGASISPEADSKKHAVA